MQDGPRPARGVHRLKYCSRRRLAEAQGPILLQLARMAVSGKAALQHSVATDRPLWAAHVDAAAPA